MSEEITLESLQADVGKLRQELAEGRRELVDARVERAAKHLEWMRNWMAIDTPTVTLVSATAQSNSPVEATGVCGREDSNLFEEAKTDIERHFDFLRVHRLDSEK